MRRVLVGVALGMLAGIVLAHGEERPKLFNEVTLTGANDRPLSVPATYGRLVGVVVNADIHYLYFEDSAGTIRVVLLGAPGAVQRSRTPLQQAASEVYVIKRGSGEGASETSGDSSR